MCRLQFNIEYCSCIIPPYAGVHQGLKNGLATNHFPDPSESQESNSISCHPCDLSLLVSLLFLSLFIISVVCNILFVVNYMLLNILEAKAMLSLKTNLY